jgi:molybdenum cofactor cytidylyltransferase
VQTAGPGNSGIDLDSESIAVVVLAAGASSRMGEQHKLRLPLGDGRTVLEHTCAGAARWHPAQLVVVTQPGMDLSGDTLNRVRVEVVPNPEYMNGMSTSLHIGVAALDPSVEAVLVLLGDQPDIADSIIAALLAAYKGEGKAVTTPVYGKVPGPPILFKREVFSELMATTGDEGGRSVVRRDPSRVARVMLPAEAMPPDIDTPEDYNRYLAREQG